MVEQSAPQRKYIVGGNWKSNGTVDFVRKLVQDTLNPMVWNKDAVDVVVFPLAIHITSAKAMLKSEVEVGAQNVSAHKMGAYTGEISAD